MTKTVLFYRMINFEIGIYKSNEFAQPNYKGPK